MVQNNLTPAPPPEESMLQQAIAAIRAEQFVQAREILTNLLHTDQQNPEYWIWLSAAMETQRERLYCLQTAFKLDPTNATTRRGLALLGALPQTGPIQPFPLSYPPLWEEKAKQEEKRNKPKFSMSLVFRLATAIGLISFVLIGTIVGVGILTKPPAATLVIQGTMRPTVTPYATNSNKSAPAASTLRPLAGLLSTPYTSTPIYAATPHGEAAGDSYKGAIRAYNNSQWENVAVMMAQVATSQPGSADALYFIGEANRLSGKYQEAINYYRTAIELNSTFAPSYLGRARANIALNPLQDVIGDLNLAIRTDPNYSEAYLERGLYFIKKKDLKSAQTDLEMASGLGDSPLVEINLARVLLAQHENAAGLEAAQRANQMDVTMLEGYLVLGMALQANGQIDQAVDELETYLQYQPDNAEAFAMLGAAYYSHGDYINAEDNLTQSLRLNANNADGYFWLGQTYLAQKNNEKALVNYQKARSLIPESFDFSEGLAKAYMAIGEYNNSYVVINKAEKYAESPSELARFLFIRAQSLEQLNQGDSAFLDWSNLLALPVGAATEEMRQIAQARIATLHSPTPAAKAVKLTLTATATVTPAPLKPSNTPRPTDTRMPRSTALASPTPTR